jgi:hypothetical protein
MRESFDATPDCLLYAFLAACCVHFLRGETCRNLIDCNSYACILRLKGAVKRQILHDLVSVFTGVRWIWHDFANCFIQIYACLNGRWGVSCLFTSQMIHKLSMADRFRVCNFFAIMPVWMFDAGWPGYTIVESILKCYYWEMPVLIHKTKHSSATKFICFKWKHQKNKWKTQYISSVWEKVYEYISSVRKKCKCMGRNIQIPRSIK